MANSERRDQPKNMKRVSPKQRQTQIAELAIKKFLENPSTFWASFPELAHAIELHLQEGSRGRRRVPVFEGYMTEREKEFKLQALSETIERYRAARMLQPDEAQKALALAAALQQHAQAYKQELLEIVVHIIGVPLDSPDPQKASLVRGKTAHHTFELVRGLTLSLAWDGELVAIELDPEEYQKRQKALSLVGIASDPMPDVASNHDAYLWDAKDVR